jgi:hypothetical protein
MTNKEQVPIRFRYALDGCPSCTQTLNLPEAIYDESKDGIRLSYSCACGRTWTTGWRKTFASAHSRASQQDLLEAGLKALNEQRTQAVQR